MPARRLRARFLFFVNCSALSKSGFLIQEMPTSCQANTYEFHDVVIVVSFPAFIEACLFVSYCKEQTLVPSEVCGVEISPHLPAS